MKRQWRPEWMHSSTTWLLQFGQCQADETLPEDEAAERHDNHVSLSWLLQFPKRLKQSNRLQLLQPYIQFTFT